MFDAILFFGKLIFGVPGMGETVALVLAVVIWLEAVPKRMRMRPSFIVVALLIAMLATSSGVLVGALVGFAVMFGPSYLTGDFIGLPWLTMLPAIGLGGLAGAAAAGTAYVTGRSALLKMVAHYQAKPIPTLRLDVKYMAVKARDLVQPISIICLPFAIGYRHWWAAGACAIAFLVSMHPSMRDPESGDDAH